LPERNGGGQLRISHRPSQSAALRLCKPESVRKKRNRRVARTPDMTTLKIPDGPDAQSRPVGKPLLRPATPHPKGHQQTAEPTGIGNVDSLNPNVIHTQNPRANCGVPSLALELH
jgi:hypothetical protein